jgi:hypothetical protein
VTDQEEDVSVLCTERRDRLRPRWFAAGIAVVLGSALAAAPPAFAADNPQPRVDLRVLVVSANDAGTGAIMAEMDREGVPYKEVQLAATGRDTITDAFLENPTSHEGYFQAVVLPNQAGTGSGVALSAAEIAALAAYEKTYGVRQVNAYDYPSTFPAATVQPVSPSGMGADFLTGGTLDGTTATVTPAAKAAGFSYLNGPVPIEDADPSVTETYGYLAQGAAGLPAGSSFTPLVTDTLGTAIGSIVGTFAHDGREELVVTAAFNDSMQWFHMLAPGIVSWATRGVNLGYHRNYFSVQVDDIFLPDSRWSSTGHCTPGDNCVDPNVKTTDIRMLPADVDKLVAWQSGNTFPLDMVFNGGGSDLWKQDTGAATDPLLDSFTANKAAFTWISHTYTHPYLGCIQIAPTVVGGDWHCATTDTETPRMDAEIPGALAPDGRYYATQAYITQQLQDNITWAASNGLPNFDPAVLVTGEHSGLKTMPEQPEDNPFLAPALASLGITVTASDASREPGTRAVSATTSTLPRHPMNIFYNAGTFQDEVDEYNWIYTSASNGGGDEQFRQLHQAP